MIQVCLPSLPLILSSAGLEREVHAAVAHVKESMEMVESAILDKDQVSQEPTSYSTTMAI